MPRIFGNENNCNQYTQKYPIPYANSQRNGNTRGSKFNFSQKKDNTICSLHQVEHFLCNTKNILKCIRLYNILKW